MLTGLRSQLKIKTKPIQTCVHTAFPYIFVTDFTVTHRHTPAFPIKVENALQLMIENKSNSIYWGEIHILLVLSWRDRGTFPTESAQQGRIQFLDIVSVLS